MIHMLYLASGNARRFHGNKLLAMVDGKPLFLHGLELLDGICRERGDCTLTVISQYPQIRQYARQMGIREVDSPGSPLGLSHTIAAGIRSIPGLKAEDFLVFCVADQPNLTKASLYGLLDQAIPGTSAARLCWQDRPGNPVLFAGRLAGELLDLTGDQGGGSVAARHGCVWVQVSDPRELADVDTPEDLLEGWSE